MKKIITLLFFFALPVTTICFGQTNKTESLTICTYYPAPTGVYLNLKLKPSDTAPSGAALKPGVIYYDNTTDVMMYYNQTGAWVNLTGGSGGPYWAFNNTTNVTSNINTGKVIIDGTQGWPGALNVYADMRIMSLDSNTTLYLDRSGDSGSSSPRFVFNTSEVWDAWVLGSAMGTPTSTFVIGNMTNASDHHPFYFLSVNKYGNVGLCTKENSVFTDPLAKLHILEYGTDDYREPIVLEGNGRVGIQMVSASNNTTLGPVMNLSFARRNLTSPLAVVKEDSLFGIMPGGLTPGDGWQNAGSISIAASGAFNSTSNPAHIHFYGMGTNGAWDNRICVIHSGEIDFGVDTWCDYQFRVCVGPDCNEYGGFYNKTFWEPTSDVRFKKNISGIEDALEKVLRAKGIRYDLVTDTSSIAKKGRLFGFVGQDLEKVMPELVDTDSQGYKGVGYDEITPVLVEAIKDQQKQIESLRQEAEALRARKKRGRI